MQAAWLAFFGTPERDRTATTASGGLGTIHYATGAYITVLFFHLFAFKGKTRKVSSHKARLRTAVGTRPYLLRDLVFPKTETIIPKRTVKHKGF